MAVNCTNVTLSRDTVAVQAPDAATATTIDATEVFTITPTKRSEKILLLISVADAHGTVVCTLGAGDYWAKKAKSFNAVQNKISVFQISDIARFLTDEGTILLTLTPASGKRLKTDHAATVQVIELP